MEWLSTDICGSHGGFFTSRKISCLLSPARRYPNINFLSLIVGARGLNHKRMQEETGCRIVIRGRDIDDKWQ